MGRVAVPGFGDGDHLGPDVEADGRIDHTVDVIIGSEQPGAAGQPGLKVALPDGQACLPQIKITEVNG